MTATAITLVCNPAHPVIDEALAEGALNLLSAFGNVERRTLNTGVAEDFILAGRQSPEDIAPALRPLSDDMDIIIQPASNRRKRLLIADMDSTIIGQECIDELADFAGLKPEIAAITERAMRGEIDFDEALKERVGKLAGLQEDALQQCYDARIRVNPGAGALVATMNSLGAATLLVSGGFTFFVERVARACGFQHYQANSLIVANSALTGEVGLPILGREAKETALHEYASRAGVALPETLAVGDGANDLAMIAAAGLGVAYHAKPKVAAAADASIRHGDLTALLYAQGIPFSEFVPT